MHKVHSNLLRHNINSRSMQPNKLLPGLSSLHKALRRTVQSGSFSNEARVPLVCRMTTQNGAHGEL